jgi:hypothetical protein
MVLAWAAGYCVLWLVAGAMGGVEMVWFRGGHGRGLVCSSLLLHVSWLGPGQGRQGGRQGESRALLGGQGLGLGLPTTVANSCFDFV